LGTIVSLVIGRGGSSFKRKNIRLVNGFPLVQWSCAAAKRSSFIDHYYCSSDDREILMACESVGFKPLVRPDILSTDSAQSCDVVKSALAAIESDLGVEVSILVLQHANVGTITERMIDECILCLINSPTATAVVPAHEKNEYHPARSKFVDDDGFLIQALEGDYSANRQELPVALFFDHSFWVLTGDSARNNSGQLPWPCMGNKIIPYVTNGCFDVHDEEDLLKTEKWLIDHNVQDPL